jgi:hypothetical protein
MKNIHTTLLSPNNSLIPSIRSANISGIKKLSSDINSRRLFCIGVPVNINILRGWKEWNEMESLLVTYEVSVVDFSQEFSRL